MNAPEIALHHQRLALRSTHIRSQIERIEAELAGDSEMERLRTELAESDAARVELEVRLRDRDREVEARRARVRSREKELMSGRVGNPTELIKLSQEVDRLKAGLSEEEDRELELMAEEERLDRLIARLREELAGASARVEAAAPDLRERLERDRAALEANEVELAEVWTRLPADWQVAYRRVSNRTPQPVAEVVGGQCQACRVGVTSSGMQLLRRAALVECDNCGRILVVA